MSEFERFYTSSVEAYEQAGERLVNERTQERAWERLGGEFPPGFEDTDNPKGVYAPYLATGSEVEIEFVKMATEAGFTPVAATYEGAEFVTANAGGLVECYRPALRLPKNQQQAKKWIVDESYRRGAVGDAATVYSDIDIVEFWKGVRAAVYRQEALDAPRTVDFSDWYDLQASNFGWNGQRSKSPFYYKGLMTLYASGRAVLFDTPPSQFFGSVMLPAYRDAEDNLDVSPLLVNEFTLDKRDWVDLSFLGSEQLKRFQACGRISAVSRSAA